MPRQLFADLTAPNKPGGRCNNGHFFIAAKSLRADQQRINGFVYLGFTLGGYPGGGWKGRNLYRSQEGFFYVCHVCHKLGTPRRRRAAEPRRAFRLAGSDREAFLKKMMARVNLLPASTRPGAAYAISKYFVIWYARSEAARFGARGVRVLSVTPGNFDTPMGALEKEEAGTYLKFNAIPRLGKPEEIAALFAAVSDPAMGYLTGTDILCDGGCLAGARTRRWD